MYDLNVHLACGACIQGMTRFVFLYLDACTGLAHDCVLDPSLVFSNGIQGSCARILRLAALRLLTQSQFPGMQGMQRFQSSYLSAGDAALRRKCHLR
jgi:hypothetical protein